MDWLTDPQAWIALLTLTVLEVVLGIDNIVFISILTGRLDEARRLRARRLGLLMALVMRILLLTMLSWIMGLSATLFTVFEQAVSGRDLILMLGGVFLIGKSTTEIHHALEGRQKAQDSGSKTASFGATLTQIALLDMVFSLDSVITAVGMARDLAVMVIAVIISVLVMVLFVDAICNFVERHPTFKMLALSFLLLIGVALVGESFEQTIPKGYIYFAMGFSLVVELLNMRVRGSEPVGLRGPDL